MLTNGFAVIIPQTIRWIIDAGVIQQNMDILLSSLLGLLLLTVVKGLVDLCWAAGRKWPPKAWPTISATLSSIS